MPVFPIWAASKISKMKVNFYWDLTWCFSITKHLLECVLLYRCQNNKEAKIFVTIIMRSIFQTLHYQISIILAMITRNWWWQCQISQFKNIYKVRSTSPISHFFPISSSFWKDHALNKQQMLIQKYGTSQFSHC